MTAVHQLLPVLTSGDAIGGAVLTTRRMLTELGYSSEIYADVIAERLSSAARPASELRGRVHPGDAVVYHLSVGSPLATLFASLPARRVVVYHNITPPRYFESTSPRVVLQLIEGRRQLGELAGRTELCIADSEYNATEARQCGFPTVVVVPPPVDLARLRPVPAAPTTPPYALFVGRFAVNKRHDTLIRCLAVLAADGLPLRLVLVGTAADNRDYVSALRTFAGRLGVSEQLEIHADRISDAGLRRMYRGASLFVTASEHEGFCVPLVEAMSFHLPVVARAAAAIPATLGDAGLLIDGDDPLLMAAVIARVMQDEPLRRRMVASGQQRLAAFAHPVIETQLANALISVGIRP